MSTKKNEVATVDETANLPAILSDIAMDAASNSGFENVKAEDVSIPFVKILQAMSPQVKGSTKIPGAADGDFFNTVTEKIYKGSIKIIPCAFQKAYVEWVAREQGGGFVKQHFDSAILEKTKKDDKNRDILANGHTIVTTAYHYCILVCEDGSLERVVLSLTSTQLKKSRRWVSQMMSLQITSGTTRFTPPMYSHIYDVTTREESNEHGAWYGFIFGTPTMISDKNIYLYAKKFHDDISGGLVKAAEPIDPDDGVTVPPAANEVVHDKF